MRSFYFIDLVSLMGDLITPAFGPVIWLGARSPISNSWRKGKCWATNQRHYATLPINPHNNIVGGNRKNASFSEMEVHALNGQPTLINRAINREPIREGIDGVTLKSISERAMLLKLSICLPELIHGQEESRPMATFASNMQNAVRHRKNRCQHDYCDHELSHNGKCAKRQN
jgi:hypothetical protein